MQIESLEQLIYYKFLCLDSQLNFTRYFFKAQYGRKFLVGDHHLLICDLLDKIVRGEMQEFDTFIINMPPRYGKTELVVKNFIARGFSINPKCKFIHLSYSDDLALDNSETARDIIALPE